MVGDTGRRSPAATAGVAAGVLLVAVLLVSPFAVALVAERSSDVDWARLGDISETLGTASTLLSALAVAGVAVSIMLQTRQLKVGQIQAMRGQQVELMRFLLDDPTLASTSPTVKGISEEQWRQEIYINLLFKYLEMGYATDYVAEAGVRGHLREQFDVASARYFWARARDLWKVNASNAYRRRFYELVDAEYQAALVRHAHRTTEPLAVREGPGRLARSAKATYFAIGASTVAAAAAVLTQRRHGRRRKPVSRTRLS